MLGEPLTPQSQSAQGAIAQRAPRSNPYPGLRPFTVRDADRFFGREGQSDALVAKLATSRFVAVVGTSGSGKSSLVHAGLRPSLGAGYLQPAGSDWCVAEFCPGSNPLGRLTDSLNESGFFPSTVSVEDLEGSSRGLRRLVEHASRGTRRNLLILADQFEELFTFEPGDEPGPEYREEQCAFVRALLDVSHGAALPVYVVITMRSDFIGECAQFRDLPEAVSDAQYLVPRTTREQRRAIIEGPARLEGAAVSNSLVQRLLNDVGEDPDQLPLLQHALMRTWQHWEGCKTNRAIDVADYEQVGTLSNALSQHADEAWHDAEKLVPGGGDIVRKLFQRLRDRDESGREVRLPTPLHVLAAVAGVDESLARACVEQFRMPERSFLRVSKDDEVNVTHECLLRQWKTLARDWVSEELESRRVYTRLVDRAEEGQLLVDPVLQFTLDWWKKRQPNPIWAARYDRRFELAEEFLWRSARARERGLEVERQAQVEREQRLEAEQRAQEAARELRREVERKAREARLQRVLVIAGVVVAAVLFVMLVELWRAYQDQAVAVREAKEAEDRAELARQDVITKMLAIKAAAQSSDRSAADVAVLLAAASLKRSPTLDTQVTLSTSLSTLPLGVMRIATGQSRPRLAFAAGGRELASAGGGKLAFWSLDTGQPLRERSMDAGAVVALDVSSSAERAAVRTLEGATVLATDADDDRRFALDCPPSLNPWISIDDAGETVVASCGNGARFYFQQEGGLEYREKKQRFSQEGIGWIVSSDGSAASRMRWDAKASRFAYSVYSLSGDPPKTSMDLPVFDAWDVARDDLEVVAGRGTNLWSVRLGDVSEPRATLLAQQQADVLATPNLAPTLYEAAGTTLQMALSRDGGLFAGVGSDGTVQLWQRASGREVLRTKLDLARPESGDDLQLVVDARLGRIAVADARGDVFVVTPSSAQSSRLRQPVLSAGRGTIVASHPDFGLSKWPAAPGGMIDPSARALNEFNAFGIGKVSLIADLLGWEFPMAAAMDGPHSTLASWRFDTLHVVRGGRERRITLPSGLQMSPFGNAGTPRLWLSADGEVLIAGFVRRRTSTLDPRGTGSASERGGGSFALVSLAGDEESSIAVHAFPPGATLWSASPSGGQLYADSEADGSSKSELLVYALPGEGKWQPTGISCQGGCTALAVSPDGGRIAVAETRPAPALDAPGEPETAEADGWVVVSDAQGGGIATLPHHGAARAVAFSTHGRELAVADSDAVHVWDVAENKELARFASSAPVKELGFSADDRSVVILGANHAEALFFRTDDIIADACRRVRRDLSEAEWKGLVPGVAYQPVCPKRDQR